MLEDVLTKIGLTDNEAKIYICLLTLGPQAVSVIATKVDLNRTTAYSILNSLEKKGIVSCYNSKGVKCFVANDPNCLVAFLDRRTRTFDYYRDQLLTIIPQFRDLIKQKSIFDKPAVNYFDGLQSVTALLNELKGDDAYLVIPDKKWWKLGFELISEKFFKDCKELRTVAPNKKSFKTFLDGRENLVFVPGEQLNDFLVIFEDKVLIIDLEKDLQCGIVIEDKEFAMMQRQCFDWAFLLFKDK